MGRPLRIEFEGALYHLTARGNCRAPIFTDGTDRKKFLDTFAECNNTLKGICHAYCLMGNHYHLILETPGGNLSAIMKSLNSKYSQWFNFRQNRSGHLFQGRYSSILIQRETHLLEACRYIVNNPVKAGLCSKPEHWPWSSYRATAGLEQPHPCLNTQWMLEQFDSNLGVAVERYKEFVADSRARRIWDDLIDGLVLGDSNFASKFGVKPQHYVS